MKPTSGQGSSRAEASQRPSKKAAKGKRMLPTISILKSVKTIQPVQPFAPWTGDESQTFKISQKPIFEDSSMTNVMSEKYPNLLRIPSLFTTNPKFEDPEVTLSFSNPEVDPKFASALFLCLAKGVQFFESGTFHVIPSELNPCGRYCIRMYENGLPIRLIFDDRIPVDASQPPKSLLLRHTDQSILMPTLLHKAFLRFNSFEPYTALDVVTAFTGFVHFEVPLDWPNLSFWFGRPDSIVALYIKNQRNEGLGSDKLFHILDMVDLDQHRKFVKLQCPGAQWRGRFSGFEEDTRHWTNQIRVILELDPETAATAGYFWMIWDDIAENFDCIMIFAPVSTFSCNVKRSDAWVTKESQFYIPPPPAILKTSGTGIVHICCAPLLTTSPSNEMNLTLRRFSWNSPDSPLALEVNCSKWTMKTLEITKQDELLEFECISHGGFVVQALSNDVKLEFVEYSDVISVTSSEADLPFYVSIDEYVSNVFAQRFELIGKVQFNLDQPGNVSFALFLTNLKHKPHVAALLFNCETNEVVVSKALRSKSMAMTPNKKGYIILVFGLYPDSIFSNQPVDLVGKWRLKIFSDIALSDVVDTPHNNYIDVEGECNELDESHQFVRHVLTGGCEAAIELETSQPLSLSLSILEDEKTLSCVRGVGFCVIPGVHLPGEKEATRLIVRGVCSESPGPFTWKLRVFSTANVNIKEDTAPAEKTAGAIAAWERKRNSKPQGGKKMEAKQRTVEAPVALPPPVIDQTVLSLQKGEEKVLAEEQVEELIPKPDAEQIEKVPSENSLSEPGDDLRDAIANLGAKINEEWDSAEAKRATISKLYAPPPKPD